MLRAIRVMLHPNNKQNTRLLQCAGAARWAYNWALSREQENYANGEKFLSAFDLSRELTALKKSPEYSWLSDVSRAIAAAAIKDAVIAYQNFFKGRAKLPRFKSKARTKPSFYLEGRTVTIHAQHVRIEKLSQNSHKAKTFNWVKLAEKNKLPVGGRALSARVTHDGLNWWISAVFEFPDNQEVPTGEPIGIDLGVKTLATCSDGSVYENVNHTYEVRRLEKKLRRLQRQLSRKYETNKVGQEFVKTKNISRLEKQILLVRRRLTNIRQNHRHQSTAAIVKKMPQMMVMENLDVSQMLKNKHLSKAIQDQGFFEFQRQVGYKAAQHNIRFIIADRFFPSSQLCSVCGAQWPGTKNLGVRNWVCPKCGSRLDRDLNAAINLRNYGLRLA